MAKETNIFIKVEKPMKTQLFAEVEKRKKSGKLLDAENISSITRDFWRNWLRKP